MKKIGFFGGCFNPPTNVHIKIANTLIEERKLDKVVFVPVNDCYNKKDLEKAEHRLNMLKLSIKDYSNLDVDDIELKENKNLCAFDAFKLITQNYTYKNDIFFIMGSDNFNKMPKWKNYNLIKNKYKYMIIERDSNIINSTTIRQMLKENNMEVKKYLNERVYEYIKENNLYSN